MAGLTSRNGSAFDLAALYILLHAEERTDSRIMEVSRMVNNILADGHTFEEARFMIIDSWKKGKKGVSNAYPNNHNNILKPGFYYHKELRVPQEMPMAYIDEETGAEVSLNRPEFYVEPVASYTLKQLKNYLDKTGMIDSMLYSDARVMGLLKYYVNKFGLETTLYMIDNADGKRKAKEEKIQLEKLDRHYAEAVQDFKAHKENNIKAGGNKCVLRSRKGFAKI